MVTPAERQPDDSRERVDEIRRLLMNDESKDPAENEDLGKRVTSMKWVEQDEGDSSTEQDGEDLSSDEDDSSAAGLLYLAGVYKSNRQCLEELWGQDGNGIEKFDLVMSIKRFKILIRCLRFNDRITRRERKALHHLAPIRESMAAPLFGSGPNITADNWFTDFNLIHKLKTKKLSFVGTVRKNKRYLPFSFVDVKGRAQYSNMSGFNDGIVLVSYIPRKGKNVIVASSLHCYDAIDPRTEDKMGPELITFYSSTKSGLDIADQMCAPYNVQRNIKCWPMVIFCAMLNVGGINSQVIYLSNQLEPMCQQRFLKRLAHELLVEEMLRRSQMMSGLHTSMQIRLKRS
ncbi:hypothetical protein ILUMI_06333 [Ignelater luminosus]|uniref:PiggyBac transposable element-derived protein domain-containing protein n=1 Tax=Ignelater luminosus TaxID=2038154 RepID=A0A8K0D8N8_IGNLU|nr:hypothetical protein ILUMI_06333 [Ignelater luminosus]